MWRRQLVPNFFVPLVQLVSRERTGGRQGGLGQQTQQPAPMVPQKMIPRGMMYRYPPSRNVPDGSMPGVAGGKLSVPYDMGGMLPQDAIVPHPMPITALAYALANASPKQQWTMLDICS